MRHLQLGQRSCTIYQAGYNTSAPRLLGIPPFARPNAAACRFGRYCRDKTTDNTRSLVSQDTLPVPFKTRETVAVETRASWATSFTVDLGRIMSLRPSIL